ncbi:MAG: M3 family metallopeptidase, partial [Kiritimatiellaeota bacterium]|nr:M3 family metallopeptidase [Kiritimatiellota bacterium]
SVIPPIKEDRLLNAFGHIFTGGYSAGYYSYMWADVLAADAFEAFKEAGFGDAAKMRKLGRKFGDTVLGLGGSLHPSEVFRLFRGRDPDPDALMRANGLM